MIAKKININYEIMKMKEFKILEIYEAPTVEIHDLEVELVYLETGGGSGTGGDVPGDDLE